MAGIRELRGRITSVGNIQQITRAMEMVATTKLRRFQDRAVASRPYTEEISGLVGHLAAVLGGEVEKRPLFRAGEGKKVAILIVASDRGLCGAYNTNVFRALEIWRRANKDVEADFFVYGSKAYKYLTKRGHKVERYFIEPVLEKMDYRGAARTATDLQEAFLSGTYSNVRVLYSAFQSMAKYIPTWVDFLPIQAASLGAAAEGDPDADKAAAGGDVILEPDAGTIFDRLVPKYLETRIYNALIEAITSEYASRRMSMKNATDAAGDMKSELKGLYNRKRQEGITKELLDLVGGVEALR